MRPSLLFLLLLFAADTATTSSDTHFVSIVVDDEERQLRFAEEDNHYELAAAFAASHGLTGGGHHQNQHQHQQAELEKCASPSAYGCVVDAIVAEMALVLARQVASDASAGARAFAVNAAPGQLKSLLVVDDFLSHPLALREFGLSCDFAYKGNHPGQRTVSFANHAAFRPLRRRVEQLVGEPLPYWFASFQRSLANDTDNNVHRDFPTYRYSALLYLTPDSPPTLGTSTWRHRASGLYGWPSDDEVRRAWPPPSSSLYGGRQQQQQQQQRGGDLASAAAATATATAATATAAATTTRELVDMMQEDGAYNEERFEEIDRVGNRFNRLLVFNSRLNHRSSSLGGAGSVPDDARLFLVMFFNTEDKVGQDNSVLWCDPDSHEFWGRGDPCATKNGTQPEPAATAASEGE